MNHRGELDDIIVELEEIIGEQLDQVRVDHLVRAFIELYTGAYLPLDEAGRAAYVAGLGEEARAQFKQWATACTSVHNRNKHKFDSPMNLNINEIPDMRR